MSAVAPANTLWVTSPRGRRLRRAWSVPALAALLVLTAVVSAGVGSMPIPLSEVVAILLGKLGIVLSAPVSDTHDSVLMAIRFPRIVLGALVGASLGLSGASMQGVFRNPLVEPGLLGVSNGAALFSVGTIVLGARFGGDFGPVVLPAMAFAGALLAMAVVQALAKVEGRASVSTMLLAGIAVNALCGALIGILTYMANDAQLRTITFWTLGSLGGATWQTTLWAAPFMLVPILLLPRFGGALDILLLGEAEAAHLGVAVARTRRVVMALSALAVGAAVSLSGVLAFVGLVVPHLVRLVIGPEHRTLLPASALLGASLLMTADAIARVAVAPAELPLGIVTIPLGTPFFIALLARERRRLS